MASNNLIRGGKMPSRAAVASYLFGPFLLEEFSRYRFQVADAATPEQKERGDILPARFSINRLVDILNLQLPPEWTPPVLRADARNRDGSFKFAFERRLLSDLRTGLTSSADPFYLRLGSFLKDDDPAKAWNHVITRFQGAHYSTTRSYQALLANIATIFGAVELFILRQLEGEGPVFIRDAPRIWREMDTLTITTLATKYGISPGIVIAALIQLAARKGSGLIRAGLDHVDPNKRNFDPLEDALWKPLFPGYKSHPYYSTALEKCINPALRGKPGRPSAAITPAPVKPPGPIPPPPSAPTEPVVAKAPPPVPTTKHLSELVKVEDDI